MELLIQIFIGDKEAKSNYIALLICPHPSEITIGLTRHSMKPARL